MDANTKKKNSLGRGLGSLFGEEATTEEGVKIRTLAVGVIHANPHQPRKYFPTESLEELINSIKEQGVLQPILVRSLQTTGVDGEFQIVAGERRWRAAVAAGLSEIPAIVRELNDYEVLEIGLLENIQREDLNPVDIARALQRLMDEFDYTHKKIAERIGKNRITITNYLRILRLPEEILEKVAKGTISQGHAKALLGLGEDSDQTTILAERIIQEELSVRETERIIQEILKKQAQTEEHKEPRGYGGRRKDASVMVMEQNLTQLLGTKVSITNVQGKGKITLEYHSLEELEKITGKLMSTQELVE
ncbi:MAG: ParB/RepB/Spo0J family partition protein [Magnetococcales bacterium]|nr:ParB/RepB/Spo0J family partition protein [Magnetococcales bacterium]